jgi:hypothetical protein
MKELQENLEPINQKAKGFLTELGEVPDPSALYCLQLALWGLDQGGLEVHYEVKEFLQIIVWTKPPGKVMNWLERIDLEDPEETLDLLYGHKTPEDLAWSVLDRLEDLLEVRARMD